MHLEPYMGDAAQGEQRSSLLLGSCHTGLCCPSHTGWELLMLLHNRYSTLVRLQKCSKEII